MNKHFEENEENFEELLEQSFSGMKSYEPGELVEAEIVSISGDSIFLQLSGKSEGILDGAEMLGKDGELTVKEGDKIKAFFLSSKNGELNFTTKISGEKAGKAVLENAFENGIPVEGIVQKEVKGGFEIKIGESRAFCPYSQMGSKRIDNPETYVGKNLTFKIIEHGERGRNILVSNRAILDIEKDKQIDILKKTLKENMDIEGTITSIQTFGAFVDLDGVQALLPISEISRSRVEDINKALTVGEVIKAKIIKLDWQNERITLSLKSLLSDPWDDVGTKYKAGSDYSGEVIRITDFGAFVSLEPGLDGLLHISELQGDSRDNNPGSFVKKGETLNVRINSIDSDQKRISLKLVSSAEEEENFSQYMEPETESDTYNPFAAFVKESKGEEFEEEITQKIKDIWGFESHILKFKFFEIWQSLKSPLLFWHLKFYD